MASTNSTVVVIPIDLGAASIYDQDVYPPEYYTAPDNFSKGNVLIRATLDEMALIKQLGIDLNENHAFIMRTRRKVEDLKVKKIELQDTRKTLNPVKAFLNYRAKRLYHAASRALYLQTKHTSEKIHREHEKTQNKEGHMQVIPTTHMRSAHGAPPGATIGGIAIDLPDGLTEEAKRTINDARVVIATTDPFIDNSSISQLRDDEHEISLAGTESVLGQDVGDEGGQTSTVFGDLQRSRPTTPQTIHYHIIQNSVVNTNSTLTGLTFNHGERNSGASITQEFAP